MKCSLFLFILISTSCTDIRTPREGKKEYIGQTFRDEEVIELYHRHGEMEQYHSEIKTDLGAEQLPSGKFKTNELILELIQLAYNMLRMMGQASLQLEGIPMKRPVKRRRLRTVLGHIIMTPAVVTKHARKTGVDLGRSNPWRNAVAQLWERFHKTAWKVIFFMRHCTVCGIFRMPLLRYAVFLKNQSKI